MNDFLAAADLMQQGIGNETKANKSRHDKGKKWGKNVPGGKFEGFGTLKSFYIFVEGNFTGKSG